MRNKIYPGLCCLFVLVFSIDMVNAVPQPEMIAGLMKVECNIVLDALIHSVLYPAEIAHPGIIAGFSATGNQFDFVMVLVEKWPDVNGFEHWLVDNLFMADGKL